MSMLVPRIVKGESSVLAPIGDIGVSTDQYFYPALYLGNKIQKPITPRHLLIVVA